MEKWGVRGKPAALDLSVSSPLKPEINYKLWFIHMKVPLDDATHAR